MSTAEKKSLIASDDEAENLRRLKAYQPWAFFITFGGYFMAHFSRKCYSTVKKQLEEEAGYSASMLSQMDSFFMASYAAGNIINGKLGDTFNPTIILAIGLVGSALCLLLINVDIWFDFEGISSILGNVFILAVYFMFGLFQATGGPVGTAVMGNWFCDAKSIENRGLIFGFWTCHQYVGDITAQFSAAAVLHAGWHYTWALTIPAIANALWAILTAQLVGDPVHVGIITPEIRIRQQKLDAKRKEMAERGETMAEDEGIKPITYAQAFQIPMVIQYALAFGFFKSVNYTLFFWLPYFLEEYYSDVVANLIAAMYSFGMMPGGIIVGYASDMFGGRRALVIGVFMCILIVLLGCFALFSEKLGPWELLPMLAVMGILVGGPNNIITSAVAADLSSHPSVRGNNKSLGTLTGLINGTGSITSTLFLMLIGPIQDYLGWPYVWLYMVLSTAAGTLLMSPKIYEELFPSA